MSDIVNEKAGVQSAGGLTPPTVKAEESGQLLREAEALPPALPDTVPSLAESRMIDEGSKVATDDKTSTGNVAIERNQAWVADSAQTSPPLHRPGLQMNTPVDPTASQASSQANPSSANGETQTGGGYPPRRPPTDVAASCPEQPKRGEGMQPPPLDIEEFIREVEERKRGAKTMREIKSLGDDISELVQRGVPLGPIYEGLKRRGLVSCSRSRFGELCVELFPALFATTGRRNA